MISMFRPSKDAFNKRLSFEIPIEFYEKINDQCKKLQISKIEFIRRALTLFSYAIEEMENESYQLGLFNKSKENEFIHGFIIK